MRPANLLLFLVSAAGLASATDFALSSPAIPPSGAYPTEFTCDGESASPPLAWSNAPAGTRSFAVTMHHIPGPRDKHVYLVVYNLPANVTSLGKNARGIGAWGVNTVNGRPEYTPPCSKGPGAKTYTMTVYALSSEPTLALSGRVTMDMLLDAIKDKTLATATLDVSYARSGNAQSGPRPPQELERAIAGLDLTTDQKQKIQALVQQYGDKQRRLREELLTQHKAALSAEQYAKVEEAMRQPPPRPR